MLPAVMPHSRASQLLCNPSVRTAMMSYSALTALVYFAFLRDIGRDDDLERADDGLDGLGIVLGERHGVDVL